jgi:hypothetical protein
MKLTITAPNGPRPGPTPRGGIKDADDLLDAIIMTILLEHAQGVRRLGLEMVLLNDDLTSLEARYKR